jgi:hypothetical protein
MRRGSKRERLGTAVVLLLSAITLVMLSAVWIMKTATFDLHAQAEIVQSHTSPEPRTPLGQWLSAPFSSDLASDDAPALEARALDLDHKSDRLTEAIAVVALVGIFVALLAARPSGADDLTRDATTPLASTSSDGMV